MTMPSDWTDAFGPSVLHEFLEAGLPVFVARAPGRLDVMGGIADYSGSLVLQLPIAETAWAAIQPARDGEVLVASVDPRDVENPRLCRLSAHQWRELRGMDFDAAKKACASDRSTAWAAYILGPVLVLLRETRATVEGGLRIVIASRVPEGKGVSSSAAVEVATMRAMAALLNVEVRGEELARLCQVAENQIVGAPCGIMDQMTAALGRANELLALRCQPAIVEGYVPIPTEIGFWGIDSGIRHAVSGSDYTQVRCGAFMGYRIIAQLAGLRTVPASDVAGVVQVDDPVWKGYLANLTVTEFRERFAAELPQQIRGRDFLARYDGTTDRVTRVDPDVVYAVYQPTLHPIEENARVYRFRELLEGPITRQVLEELGALMAAAHESYSACGLGSEGTDLLVKLVRDAGPSRGVYGAKITGGGSGGTVAVLGLTTAERTVEDIARQYSAITERPTYIFRGSSSGAMWSNVFQASL